MQITKVSVSWCTCGICRQNHIAQPEPILNEWKPGNLYYHDSRRQKYQIGIHSECAKIGCKNVAARTIMSGRIDGQLSEIMRLIKYAISFQTAHQVPSYQAFAQVNGLYLTMGLWFSWLPQYLINFQFVVSAVLVADFVAFPKLAGCKLMFNRVDYHI